MEKQQNIEFALEINNHETNVSVVCNIELPDFSNLSVICEFDKRDEKPEVRYYLGYAKKSKENPALFKLFRDEYAEEADSIDVDLRDYLPAFREAEKIIFAAIEKDEEDVKTTILEMFGTLPESAQMPRFVIWYDPDLHMKDQFRKMPAEEI